MKVVIAGSRGIEDYNLLIKLIKFTNLNITEVVSGGARGVDKLGEKYAKENNIPVKLFEANWGDFGKRAGVIRNREMARYAEALIYLWDGKSSGTKNMIEEARIRGLIICGFILEDGVVRYLEYGLME